MEVEAPTNGGGGTDQWRWRHQPMEVEVQAYEAPEGWCPFGTWEVGRGGGAGG